MDAFLSLRFITIKHKYIYMYMYMYMCMYKYICICVYGKLVQNLLAISLWIEL